MFPWCMVSVKVRSTVQFNGLCTHKGREGGGKTLNYITCNCNIIHNVECFLGKVPFTFPPPLPFFNCIKKPFQRIHLNAITAHQVLLDA